MLYRFGEEPLHSCEVMLRDIEESKRVNNAVAFELSKNREVRVCCAALCCAMSCCVLLYITHVAHCTALHCTVLYCAVLYCTALK